MNIRTRLHGRLREAVAHLCDLATSLSCGGEVDRRRKLQDG